MSKAEPSRLADDTKPLAERIAKKALSSGLWLKDNDAVKGFAEVEGFGDNISDKVAALTVAYLAREYKYQKEEMVEDPTPQQNTLKRGGKLWQVTKAGLIQNVKDYREELPDGTPFDPVVYLNESMFLVRGSITDEHEDDIRRIIVKLDRPKMPTDLSEIDKLPDIEKDGQICCYLNIQKKMKDGPETFTLRVTKDGEELHHKRLSLPDGFGNDDYTGISVTQPTRGFHERIGSSFDWDANRLNLEALFKKYLWFFDKRIYQILALLSMSSYFREQFHTYPYPDFAANEIDCGKTTALLAFVWSAFYGTIQTTPTPAVIYREVNDSKCTMGIDEIDNAFKNKELGMFLTSLLNSAHTRGIPAKRCSPIDHSVQSYDAFGIKAFSRVGWIPNSIESRTIEIPMMQAPKKARLDKLKSGKVFQEFRNELYGARLGFSDMVGESARWVEEHSGLKYRSLDLFIGALTMAKLCSEKTYKDTKKWAKEYIARKTGVFLDSWSVALVEVLLEFVNTVASSKIVRGRWVTLLGERELLGENTNPRVTKKIEGLGFKRTSDKPKNVIHHYIDSTLLAPWALRYGIIDEEEANRLVRLVGLGKKDKEEEEEQKRLTDEKDHALTPSDSNLTNLTNPDAPPKAKKKTRKKPKRPTKPLPRDVVKFDKWLSRIPHCGVRGFRDNEIRKVHGDGYIDGLEEWVRRDWLVQNTDNLSWWITSKGKLALRGRAA